MHVRVLGPLEIGDSESLPGVARKTRQVIVVLALAAPASVSVDRLVDALWDDPPESAIKTVQSHVSLARKALATAGVRNPIVGGPAGYALEGGPDELDVLRDAKLRHDARDATARGDSERALDHFSEARALWRGEPELPDTVIGETERARLTEMRLALIEDHVDALISAGRSADAMVDLEAATIEDPLRERFWALRMLALYRTGRQVDALRAYQEIRGRLLNQVGVEPGPELRRLEQAILAHDADLDGRTNGSQHDDLNVRLPLYATVEGRHVAYATFGDAARDLLVLTPGFITIDAYLEEPKLVTALGRLVQARRVLALDRGGLGLSDPIDADTTAMLTRWVADVIAVLDASDTNDVDVLANADTCLVAMTLAATHRSRLRSLILIDPYARLVASEDYPHGMSAHDASDRREQVGTAATTGPDLLAMVAPSIANDDAFRSWWDRVGRRAASPATARRMHAVIAGVDLRSVLDQVEVPTTVVVRTGCPSYDPDHGRYVAEHLRNARLIETSETDDLWWLGDVDQLADLLDH